MAKISFFGATRTVTGSRFLLDIQDVRLLIDCGLFQGKKENRLRNWDPFPVEPAEIDRVLLTHAHIDHTGYLPRLFRTGFRGRVHCTRSTEALSQILLLDSAHIQMEDAHYANKRGFSKHAPALPLYRPKDAERVIKLFEPLNYGEDYYINDNLRLKFKDAGHILGSAFVELKANHGDGSRKILFGGDLGRPAQPILRDPVQVFNVDYLVLESTYGNRLHVEDENPQERLARVINESVERGGVLVIPAFAVGRTQTILYAIRELEESGKIPTLPVFVDSPMAVDATEVFENRKGDYDLESKILEIEGKQILRPAKLRFTKSRKQSKSISEVQREAIIISASGMVTAGRILHHLAERLPNPKNTVLFIGYQAEGTRGRTIQEGQPEVKIHGRMVRVNARVEVISGYSGHADYNEILAWLMGFNKPPENTFLVHGEAEASEALALKIRKKLGWKVTVPTFGDSFDLNL
jgi:metallo-beta-lactamase family protein